MFDKFYNYLLIWILNLISYILDSKFPSNMGNLSQIDGNLRLPTVVDSKDGFPCRERRKGRNSHMIEINLF